MKKILFYSFSLLLGANLLAQNVGIGTNTPDASAKLDVVDANRGVLIPRVALTSTLVAAPVATPANSLLVFNTNTAGDVTPGYYYWDSGLNRWVRLLTTQSNDWMLDGNNNGVLRTIGTNDNFDFPIETNGTEKMRVTTAGNIGIATTVPGARLDVVGPATGTGITIRAAGGGDVVLNSGGSLFFDGNYSYATGNYIRPIAANTQTFVTSGAERMRITPVGNVGIGTAAPTQRLHVSGGSILTDRSYAASTLDLAAAAAINIAQPATQVRITNVAGAQANAVTYSAAAIEGQYLWISNTDDNPATFAGATIPTNVAMGFVYTGGAWRAVRALGAGDDWNILGNAGTDETVNFIGTTDAQGLTVRTNNLQRFRFSGSAYQLLSMGNGTVGAPAYSFNPEANSGMYRSGAGSLSLSTVGIERLRVTNIPQVLSGTQGTAAAPAWSFTTATGTGIYAPLTTALGFSANGTEQFRITSGNQMISMFNGSASEPNYTWNTSTNTGFYMPAANTLGFSTAGTQRMRINNDGEVVVGTATTSPLGGDLLNGVAYGALTWAVNGYTNLNGAGVYGRRYGGASGLFGAVQGEDVSGLANSSGTAGLVTANSQRGAIGQKPAGGAGWGGLFLNDLGYSGVFLNVSDARFKKNVRPVQTVLDKVMQLTPYMYHYTLEPLGGDAYNYIGFMAQDVEKVFPDLVAEKSVVPAYSRFNSENNGKYDKVLDKVKCVSTIGLIPILAKAIQEQQQIIESQNQRIEELEKAIKKLEERIK